MQCCTGAQATVGNPSELHLRMTSYILMEGILGIVYRIIYEGKRHRACNLNETRRPAHALMMTYRMKIESPFPAPARDLFT